MKALKSFLALFLVFSFAIVFAQQPFEVRQNKESGNFFIRFKVDSVQWTNWFHMIEPQFIPVQETEEKTYKEKDGRLYFLQVYKRAAPEPEIAYDTIWVAPPQIKPLETESKPNTDKQ